MSEICSRLSKNDILHLKELSYLYYPRSKSEEICCNKNILFSSDIPLISTPISEKPNDSLPNKFSSHSISIERKYQCCDYKLVNFRDSVDHWIQKHFIASITDKQAFIYTQYGALPQIKPNFNKQCNSLADIGDSEYSLFERASYFLHQIKTVPSSCQIFKPISSIKNPYKMTNPYSAALTIAYEFIETVTNQQPEYRYFLARLLNHTVIKNYSGTLHDHLPYFVFWASYFYPNYKKTPPPPMSNFSQTFSVKTDTPVNPTKKPKTSKAISENFHPMKSLNGHINSLYFKNNGSLLELNPSKEKESFFQCVNPGCTKVYKQSSGLHYHMEPGRCPAEIKSNIYKTCPFKPCQRTSNSIEKLKIHIRKYHLHPQHSEPSETNPAFICTLCTVHFDLFKSHKELREHIKEQHKLIPPIDYQPFTLIN